MIKPAAEALGLGLSVGLVCLASCGAVLVPWLVVERRTVAGTAWLLAQVLAGRLLGYLLFAVVAGAAGLILVPDDLKTRALVFGVAHLSLAAILFWYAFGKAADVRSSSADPKVRAACAGRLFRPAGCAPPIFGPTGPRRTWAVRLARLGPVALGFLTGINLCPPFVVAAVRAAELRDITSSLAFFTVFFAGTSVWFLPFVLAGAARRVPEARLIARVALGVVAGYYAYMGSVTLGWRLMYG